MNVTVVQSAHYARKGRPPKGAKPSHDTYHPTAQLERNEDAIAIAQTKAGRLSIATNRLPLETLDTLDASAPDMIVSPPGYEPAPSQQVLSFNEQQTSNHSHGMNCSESIRTSKPVFA